MKDRYQVVVVGGGIVGCSVLYHLTLRGLTDVALIEREELTAGSTWHAAGGFHAMNADTRVAALQKYTIGLYPQVEEESGQSAGLHMSGGMELAETPERWHWLRSELQWLRTQDTDAYLLTPEEAVELVPDHRSGRPLRRALRSAGGRTSIPTAPPRPTRWRPVVAAPR